MRNEFWEAPVHCQQAAWESGIDFQVTEYREEKGNTNLLAAHEAGHSQTRSASDSVANLTATSKPQGTKGGGAAVSETSMPSADGCNYDGQGNPNCAVQSQGAKNNLIDDNSAENSGDDFIRYELPWNFREKIKERIEQGDCNDFIKRVISKAAEYTEVVRNKEAVIVKRSSLENDTTGGEIPYATDGFDLLWKIQDYVLVDDLKVGGAPVGGTVRGSIPTRNATPLIDSKRLPKTFNRKYAQAAYKGIVGSYVTIAIHEMIHLSGKYFGDQVLAQVVFDLGESTTPVDSKLNNKDWSSVWNSALSKHCGDRGQ